MFKNKIFVVILAAFLFSFNSFSQNYKEWFSSSELRVNLTHVGDSENESYYVEGYKFHEVYAGPKNNLVDTSGYGDNYFEVLDSTTNKMLFSKGFCNLFNEWQDTDEAKVTTRGFEEVIRFPFPLKTVLVKLFKRQKNGQLEKMNQFYVNPKHYRIDKTVANEYASKKLLGKKNVNEAVDVVFIAEGYTESEMDLFEDDVKRFSEFLLKTEPFNKVKKKFNIWAVYSISEDSGTDIWGQNKWANTVVNTHFYTFGSERYLTSQSIHQIHDVASHVPYDQVYILVNSSMYGGGGIYNYYNLTSTKHVLSPWVFIHEFGHGFAGLADEYYDSSVAYESFYDLTTEPWRPNISTLKNSDMKWKSMLDADTPIPTPETTEYKFKVGFFEGGGYVEKGIYRPYQNCEMKALQNGFCPVCQKAILQMVEWTCD